MDHKWWLAIAGCITHAVNTGFSYFGMSAFFSMKRSLAFGIFSYGPGLIRPAGGNFHGADPRRLFYDLTKSYAMAFAIFAVVSLLATVFMFFATPRNPVLSTKKRKLRFREDDLIDCAAACFHQSPFKHGCRHIPVNRIELNSKFRKTFELLFTGAGFA